MSTDLTVPGWAAIGASASNSFVITPTNSAAYYRIIGQ
jgi:hypothetical protein